VYAFRNTTTSNFNQNWIRRHILVERDFRAKMLNSCEIQFKIHALAAGVSVAFFTDAFLVDARFFDTDAARFDCCVP
jgi:hypothetical protein